MTAGVKFVSTLRKFGVAVAAAAFAVVAFAADTVSGSWAITFEQQGNPPIETTMKLEQKGDAVSGTIPGFDGSDVAMKGSVKGKTLELNYTIDFGQGPVQIKLTGTVDADTYTGTGDYGQFGTGKFSAKRK
jgi:hypothetical protein